jgi:hypothetical protein
LEAFTSIQDDIEKERRWFAQKWAKQEKNLRKVFDTTLGMQGDLQSIMGKSMLELEGMEISEEIIEETEKPLETSKTQDQTLFS